MANLSSTITILRPHLRDLGGFAVRRVLPAISHQTVGPFIFFDHFGPVDMAPGGGVDVRPHPHIGLATVTYLFDGALVHRDSLGSVQRIVPGDVNWMTAGRGIVHSERSAPEDRAAGIRMHGLQTWVALKDTARITARTAASVMLVGGAKLDGERFIWWNFVASSRDRIETAKAKWRAQQYGTVPGDNEFIPLPER